MNSAEHANQYFLNVYKRFPLDVEKGEGVYIFDKQGKKYLDFLSGIAVNALGYQHPEIERAILKQLKRNLHLSNYFVQDVQIEIAQRLLQLTGYSRVFLTNSGTEAIEGLLKIAKKWGNQNGKTEIIALKGSFHGRTAGALSITMQEKYQKQFLPLLPNCKAIPASDVNALIEAVNDKTLAVFYEGIMGEGGVRPLSRDFLDTLYALREKYHFLIFADEIQTGVGRTGYFYYFQKDGYQPDGFATAKGLGGGLPLGAFVVSEKLANVFTLGDHGTTYGGNPLACASGLATVNHISTEAFLNHVKGTGQFFLEKLQRFATRYPDIIVEARGYGLMLGLEVKEKAGELMFEAAKQGLLCNIAGGNTLRFVPPLIIEKIHVTEAMEKLDRTFQKVFG